MTLKAWTLMSFTKGLRGAKCSSLACEWGKWGVCKGGPAEDSHLEMALGKASVTAAAGAKTRELRDPPAYVTSECWPGSECTYERRSEQNQTFSNDSQCVRG